MHPTGVDTRTLLIHGFFSKPVLATLGFPTLGPWLPGFNAPVCTMRLALRRESRMSKQGFANRFKPSPFNGSKNLWAPAVGRRGPVFGTTNTGSIFSTDEGRPNLMSGVGSRV